MTLFSNSNNETNSAHLPARENPQSGTVEVSSSLLGHTEISAHNMFAQKNLTLKPDFSNPMINRGALSAAALGREVYESALAYDQERNRWDARSGRRLFYLVTDAAPDRFGERTFVSCSSSGKDWEYSEKSPEFFVSLSSVMSLAAESRLHCAVDERGPRYSKDNQPVSTTDAMLESGAILTRDLSSKLGHLVVQYAVPHQYACSAQRLDAPHLSIPIAINNAGPAILPFNEILQHLNDDFREAARESLILGIPRPFAIDGERCFVNAEIFASFNYAAAPLDGGKVLIDVLPGSSIGQRMPSLTLKVLRDGNSPHEYIRSSILSQMEIVAGSLNTFHAATH